MEAESVGEKIVDCADVRALMKTRKGRVVVAVILKENTTIQFVTYGRSAADKLESRDLKEFLEQAVCPGYSATTKTVHESFVIDAAYVKQERDDILEAVLVFLSASIGMTPHCMQNAREALIRAAKKAETGNSNAPAGWDHGGD